MTAKRLADGRIEVDDVHAVDEDGMMYDGGTEVYDEGTRQWAAWDRWLRATEGAA